MNEILEAVTEAKRMVQNIEKTFDQKPFVNLQKLLKNCLVVYPYSVRQKFLPPPSS